MILTLQLFLLKYFKPCIANSAEKIPEPGDCDSDFNMASINMFRQQSSKWFLQLTSDNMFAASAGENFAKLF